ncbi:MAG: hypothetical protein ACFFEO_05720 [Candidatus Thorarchaeota archaeon]
MQNTEDDQLKQAEELEKHAKIEIQNNRYDKAISLLLEARDLYTKLGLTGQVGIILKEIVRIKSLRKEEVKEESKVVDKIAPIEKYIKMEVNDKENLENRGNSLLEEARKLTLNEELDKALELYNEAYDIFKRINCNFETKQILWQINEIKKFQKWTKTQKSTKLKVPVKDILALAAAERRRSRIQEELYERKKPKMQLQIEKKTEPRGVALKESKSYKLFEQISEKERLEKEQKKAEIEFLQKRKEERTQIIKKRTEKLKQLKEQKLKEESLLKNAEENLDIAKSLIEKRQYEQAKLYFEKAIEIFTNLGWLNQVKVLKQELLNIDRYKKEYEKTLELEIIAKQKIKSDFEKKLKTMSSEQKKYQETILDGMRALPPELKAKLEKIELIKEKAAKEESLNNFSRVLDRYKYILDLYLSIPSDILNVSDEISHIKEKISELKTKL